MQTVALPAKLRVHVDTHPDGGRRLVHEAADGGPRELSESELEKVTGGTNTIVVSYPDGCEVEVVVQTNIWDAVNEANSWHWFLHDS